MVECVLVIAAPGQGAQTPGFLNAWLELPGVADRLAWWSAVTGLDLIRYGTTADADEIRDTAVAQPLLVAAALAAYEVLGVRPDVTAGHSVGELAAAAIAGVISPESAMVLVRERGRAMAEAAAVTETGMTAVLGGDEEEVLATIEKHGLTPANTNGAGQVVAAGTMEQLAAFADAPPAARGCGRCRWPERSTPVTWPPRWTHCGGSPRACRWPTRSPGCSPTATVRSWQAAATSSPASSSRSAHRCAGTPA
ncbi:hypothetical protein GCM10029978_032840 [Actinoallomurus acanthiterrae]